MIYDPCPNCKTSEMYYLGKHGITFCPSCDSNQVDYFIIPRDDAQEILNNWIEGIGLAIDNEITNNFEKYSLLQWIIIYLNSSVFSLDTPLIPIQEWLAAITLLKLVNKIPYWITKLDPQGQFLWAHYTDEKIRELIRLVMNYNLLRKWSLYNSGDYSWGSLFTEKKNIDIDKLKELSRCIQDGSFSKLVSTFDLRWLKKTTLRTVIEPSLAEKGMTPHSKAIEKYEIRKKEYEVALLRTDPPPKNIGSFLNEIEEAFSLFMSGLRQDALWDEILYTEQIPEDIDLNPLLRFYFDNLNQTSVFKIPDFINLTHQYEITSELIDRVLLSEENPTALPLFVKINSSHVMYSKRNFYFLFMYLLTRSEIGDKALKRAFEKDGVEFEKEIVPKVFEENLKMRINNIKTKNFEIDLIAYSKSVILVIEIKRWDFKPLLTLRNRLENVDRDLKGVVDGVKYTTKEGILIGGKRPSLLEKVTYVKNNRENLSLPYAPIIGMIITRLYPPRRSYKNCYFLSYEEISESKILQIVKNFSDNNL